jgi:hypothetical protein
MIAFSETVDSLIELHRISRVVYALPQVIKGEREHMVCVCMRVHQNHHFFRMYQFKCFVRISHSLSERDLSHKPSPQDASKIC